MRRRGSRTGPSTEVDRGHQFTGAERLAKSVSVLLAGRLKFTPASPGRMSTRACAVLPLTTVTYVQDSEQECDVLVQSPTHTDHDVFSKSSSSQLCSHMTFYTTSHLTYASITQLLARLGSISDHVYVTRHQLNLFGGAKIARHGLNCLVQ
jgi:hypothetical protein